MSTRRPSIIKYFAYAAVIASYGSTALALDWDGKHSRDASLFSIEEYREDMSYLASDEQEGRGTGQPGIDRAADYIAGEFQKLGVLPAGDDDSYFQHFTLALKRRIGEGTRLAVGTSGRRTRMPLVLDEDYRPFPFSSSKSFKGDVVFAGYGIVDDSQDYDDYHGVDVADKVVLLIRRSPEFGNFDQGLHASFRAKASRANARGAAAILVVNRIGDVDSGLYPFEQMMGGFGPPSYGIPMMHITEEAADKLLTAGGQPKLAELQKTIERTQKPASAELDGVSVRGEVDIEPIESPVRNVIGMIRGQGPQADEIIVLGAHYDHLGVRNKGEPGFDPAKDISNGADDNASGTALILQFARAYTQGEPPNRSILLMLFTGEEMGLLGSAHFAKNPTVDLGQCVAMLNFDMVGRLKNNILEVGGMRTGGFEDTVMDLAETYQLKIRDGGGGRGPSDHTSFYTKDIPVLFFFTGIHRQYHRPEDDIGLINYDGAIQIGRFAADIIDSIDSRAERPEFQSDSRRASITRQSDDDEPEKKDTEPVARRRPRGDRENRPRVGAPEGVRLGIVTGMDDEDGLIVAEVAEDSAAAKAGVKAEDRLVRIGKLDIKTIEDAQSAIGKLQPGDETTLGIVRDGKSIELAIKFPRAERRRERGGDRDRLSNLAKKVETELTRIAKERGEGGGFKFSLTHKGTVIDVEITVDSVDGALDVLDDVATALQKMLDSADKFDGAKVKVGVAVSGAKMSVKVGLEVDLGGERKAPYKPGERGRAGGDDDDDHEEDRKTPSDARERAPSVRLGIMPTYGEKDDDKEGYEIEGVVEGGPAAKAGMKDGDRIYKIGDRKVTNIYEYMEALRAFKPGDEVPVTVIRDGKKIELKVKASGGRVEPQ